MIASRRAAALAAVTAASLLAACGSSGGNGEDAKSADQIVKDAQAALKSASAFHLSGSIDSDGDNVVVDMKVQDKDTTSGHMSTGGVGFDFITAGGKFFFRGKQLWAKFSPEFADQIGDKWVSVSSDDKIAGEVDSVTQLADASQLADSLGATGGPYSKNGTSTFNGQPVVVVKGKDGTLDVALNGKPYPVHLDGGSHGKLDVTEYGGSFNIKAPSNALDYSDLQGSSSSSSDSTSSNNTQAVLDAAKVRDGVLQLAQSIIPDNADARSDGWGVPSAVVKQLPGEIDVVLEDSTTNGAEATPQKLVLGALHEDTADIFLVAALDTKGTCAVGALTGTPPTHGPYTATLDPGKDCTLANAIDALGS